MVNKYRNINKNLKTLFLLLMLFTMSSLVSSASLSSFKPSFDSIESTIVRKEVFFNYLLPAIHKKNAEIVELRSAISNDELSDKQINDLANKYRIKTSISKEELLKVIDILPLRSSLLKQPMNQTGEDQDLPKSTIIILAYGAFLKVVESSLKKEMKLRPMKWHALIH